MDLPNTRLWRDDPRPMASSPRFRCPASARLQAIAARFVMTVGAGLQTTSPDHRSTESKSKISVDRKRPIQGLLRLHTRYGPPDRSAALRRPLSRGSNPCSCPDEPLVSYRINRQLSGWNPPPLMMRAFGAHCQLPTYRPVRSGCSVPGLG